MTDTIVESVPNQEKTPRRTVRVPDEVWAAAKKRAAERGEDVTKVVVRALKRYARS